jgi:hypothetical protein
MALKTQEDYGLSEVRGHSCKNKIKKSCNILKASSDERNDHVQNISLTYHASRL